MTSRATGCRTDLRIAHPSTCSIRHQSIGAFALMVLASMAGAVVFSGGAGAAPNPGEWSILGRTSEQHHFSPLAAIADTNVKTLGLAWHADMPTADGLLANPLVADGLVYQIGAYARRIPRYRDRRCPIRQGDAEIQRDVRLAGRGHLRVHHQSALGGL